MAISTQERGDMIDLLISMIPTIYCEHCQSVWEAAVAQGYPEPQYRVGLVPTAKPVDGEVLVALVRALRYSLPIPIFERVNGHGIEPLSSQDVHEPVAPAE